MSGLHAGHLKPGERLASYRELSRSTGLDLRAAGRIFAALAQGGLVEVRGRQGVFLARQERIGGGIMAETARWIVDVLQEGWSRRITIPCFPLFAEGCTSRRVVKCACIESTEDQRVALCTELRDDFGFDATAVHASGVLCGDSTQPDELPTEVQDADLIVSTLYQASALRPLAESLGKPLVCVRLDSRVVEAFERRLEAGILTVVCVDPGFVDRVRMVVAPSLAGRVQGVLADDAKAFARLDRRQPVLVTMAARARLEGMELPPGVVPAGIPLFSTETATELIELLVRLNLEAMGQRHEAPPATATGPTAVSRLSQNLP